MPVDPSVGGRAIDVTETNDMYEDLLREMTDINSVPKMIGFIARAGLSVIHAVRLELRASIAETRALKGSDGKLWRRRPCSN